MRDCSLVDFLQSQSCSYRICSILLLPRTVRFPWKPQGLCEIFWKICLALIIFLQLPRRGCVAQGQWDVCETIWQNLASGMPASLLGYFAVPSVCHVP